MVSPKNNITKFLNDLLKQNIKSIENVTGDNIFKYVEKQKSYSSTTRSAILFALREFLRYLYNEHYTKQPLYDLFPVIYSNKFERLPSYYQEEERQKILAEVDINTMIGKRDYLVLVLAIQLGLRAGDIRILKLESVNWDRNTLELIQQKTGNPIQLPLPENIKFALIDYLKNSRPKTDSSFVFIRHRAPNIPFTKTNVFYDVINKYLKASKIKISGRKHGLHSMRHSMASSLLKNDTPYPVITGILGHENTDTTKKYLKIDIEQLRSVSLEVPYEK
jgi:site-specific recombinase XerD